MLKIRALNDTRSSSESEDEDNPRLSTEAQEGQAKRLYERAQVLTISKDYEEAVATFLEILELPYLNETENKNLSPVQLQLRSGCWKCLSTLYTRDPTKNLDHAINVLELITESEPRNVNFWYRLGKVALEKKDLELAHDSFQRALNCSPGHWGSIENLVTISYALHDFVGCLQYCALGLSKDQAFVKGHVFKKHVFKNHSWVESTVRANSTDFESLFVGTGEIQIDTFESKYLQEARDLIYQVNQRNLQVREEDKKEADRVISCLFTLKSLSLANLGSILLEFYEYLKNNDTLMRIVDMSNTLPETNVFEEAETEKPPLVNGDCEEQEQSCSSVIFRSRSTSNDKEPCRDSGEDSSRTVNETFQASDADEKIAEEDSQSILQTQNNVDDEQKKTKNRRDMKWWQMEGKRRSQRVQIKDSTPTTKSKPEISFAETLRSFIPIALLSDESESKPSKDSYAKHIRSQSNITVERKYFGTNEENDDVKTLLSEWKSLNILKIITYFVRWLSKINKGKWPDDLKQVFNQLYELYRKSVPTLLTFETGEIFDIDQVEDDAFTILTHTEISYDSIADSGIFGSIALLENSSHETIFNNEYYLRLEWLKVKNSLLRCQHNVMDYSYVSCHLNCILEMLRDKPSDFLCFVPTEHDFVISTAHIKEKLQFVQKIENLSRIEELYSKQEYEDLVEILVFSLSSDNSGEFQHRVYLAESYFHLQRIECVSQSQILATAIIKNGSEEKLSYILDFLDRIWKEMKDKMEIEEFKIIVNVLLKILIHIEKRQPMPTVSIMTQPWCLLHSVLYHAEKTEPAFSTDEEDNIPGSISILQMGHEILSKISKCCTNEGNFLLYSINALLELQNDEEYWSFEETKVCLDQAILCLYGHPSKKFKLKNLKDHGTTCIPMDWAACCKLYKYYRVEELPEFDSKPNQSISAEVETLFQKIVSEMPTEMTPSYRHNKIKDFVEGGNGTIDENLDKTSSNLETYDIYYLLADYHLKNQDLKKAVELYIWDLAVCPQRFDSWTAIALAKVEDIVSKINACDAFKIEEIMFEADTVIRCFRKSLDLDIANTKVRIEFGSFLYSLQSVYSRELKFHVPQISPNQLYEQIEQKQKEYLLQARDWFEPYKMPAIAMEVDDDSMHEEAWINHYMLGKVEEKLHPMEPEKFISQYNMALGLLHDKCSTYPVKINYYSPPDFALESLEVYYRIHASILRYIEKLPEHDKEIEDMLLNFVTKAEESPFIKSRQSRKTDEDSKRKAKAAEENVSKKDMAIINNLVKQMLAKVVKIVAAEETVGSNVLGSSSSGETSASSGEDSNQDNVPAPPGALLEMKSLSLSAFRERIQEEDAAKLSLSKLKNTAKPKSCRVPDISKDSAKTVAENNQYCKDFVDLSYGVIISKCLQAMKECTTRYPQCFKAYFRLARTFVFFKKDYKKAKHYLMGNNVSGVGKIVGLYGERKPSNFFHGIWRHPVEDVDRPGSFAFHMSNSMQLLLKVLEELRDHQLLAEVGIQLAKVPDSKNTYLYTEDREQYSKKAFKLCEIAAKRSISKNPAQLIMSGLGIYDTYTKFQKFNPKENVAAPALLDVYIRYCNSQNSANTNYQLSDAVKFFQHWIWSTKTQAVSPAYNMVPTSTNSNFTGNIMKKPSLKRRTSDNQRESLLPPLPPPISNSLTATPSSTLYQPPNNSSMFTSNNMFKYNTDQMWSQLLNMNPYALQLQIQNMLALRPPLEPELSKTQTNPNNQSEPKKSDNNIQEIPKPDSIINSIAASSSVRWKHQSMTKEQQILANLTKAMKFNPKPKVVNPKSVNQSLNNSLPTVPVSTSQKFPTVDSLLLKAQQEKELSNSSQVLHRKSIKATNLNTKESSIPPRLQPNPHKVLMRQNNGSQKSTSMYHGMPSCSSPNLASPQYINSSPFQAQSAIMANPAMTGRGFPASKNSQLQNSKSPQPAHSQPRLLQSSLPSTHEPEVVDLTTKSPEKTANTSSQELLEQERDERSRNQKHILQEHSITPQTTLTIKPMKLPTAKRTTTKPIITPQQNHKTKIDWEPFLNRGTRIPLPNELSQNLNSTLSLNKMLPNFSNPIKQGLSTLKLGPVNKPQPMTPTPRPQSSYYPEVTVTMTTISKSSSSTSKFPIVETPNPINEILPQRINLAELSTSRTGNGNVNNSSHTMSTLSHKLLPPPRVVNLPEVTFANPISFNSYNNTLSNNAMTGPSMQTSQSTSKAQQPIRPQKRPLPNVEQTRHYPLPPKKKHHIFPSSPVYQDPDHEVITLE